MHKPRILHLFNSFNQGGTERQMLQLVQRLRQSGRFDVLVACQSGEGVLRDELAASGVSEIPEFPLRRFYDANAVLQLRRFARHLRDSAVDLLHTHDFYTNLFGVAAAVMAGVPIRVVSRRELDVFSPLQRRVERWSYRRAQAVTANCEFLRRQLVREGVESDRAVTTYNGIDLGRVRAPDDADVARLAEDFGLPAGGRFVTMLANLSNVKKDHRSFLAAAARVLGPVPEAAFVVAGAGDQGPLRSRARELGVADRVFFTGRCDRVGALLALSEVCVLSSFSEGFSNSVLEYMAAGRPVVATDVGGLREAVDEGVTGYLVAVGDHQAMAERIAALLLDPAAARAMGVRGRERVRDRFSPERQLEETEALYGRLLEAAGKRSASGLSVGGSRTPRTTPGAAGRSRPG